MRGLQQDGWYQARKTKKHRIIKHQGKPGSVPVPGNPGDDMPPGTYANIRRLAGLK
ncbi:MAG: type II toxin-antitoxin system HicA family toxin [Chloroflexi bacterium]|nr:type II toxin-antitoxin system HicA family toxin [Chloroflexota bacterium]